MFTRSTGLKYVNMNGVNTPNLEEASHLFSGCSNLERVDISSLDVSKVSDFNRMFYNCYQLKELDLSNFEGDGVSSGNTEYMFKRCTNLEKLDMGNFGGEHVERMNNMFSYTESLKYLDISSLSTKRLWYADYMFREVGTKVDDIEIRIGDEFMIPKRAGQSNITDNSHEKVKKLIGSRVQ